MTVARTLYARRDLLNPDEFIAWFKSQGCETVLKPTALHVTIIYSKKAFKWGGADELKPWRNMITCTKGMRSIEALGVEGAIVQRFKSSLLQERWEDMHLLGAKSDYPSYKPHVTITYNAKGLDIKSLKPFTGALLFGPEIFEEIKQTFKPDGSLEKSRPFFYGT